jgi:hypothetical protein
MSEPLKFEDVFIAWIGIIDEEESAMSYQFLLPGTESDMDRAQIAGTLTMTERDGMYAFRPEPWLDEDAIQAVARNWAKFSEAIRKFNRGIRPDN